MVYVTITQCFLLEITCSRHNGQSVVDYVPVSEPLFSFGFHQEFRDFSDHAAIYVMVSYETSNQSPSRRKKSNFVQKEVDLLRQKAAISDILNAQVGGVQMFGSDALGMFVTLCRGSTQRKLNMELQIVTKNTPFLIKLKGTKTWENYRLAKLHFLETRTWRICSRAKRLARKTKVLSASVQCFSKCRVKGSMAN